MEHATWIEDVALSLEESGVPRIAGRIVGLLMICDPPHRSSSELVSELGASKASISTMTRQLYQAGTIEKVAIPGERATYYRLASDSLERKLTKQVARMVGFHPLAQRGLELLADAPPERRERLETIQALYAFMERELPDLIARWSDEKVRLGLR